MLSIGKMTAGREDYYVAGLSSGDDEYYLDPIETPGRWTGAGSYMLGLDGPVEAGGFRAVLAGLNPETGMALVANAGRPGRVTGFDLTFSAPKSVSLLWALSDPETARMVAEAHDRAVGDALYALEREAVAARRGHGGVAQVRGQGLVAAGFGHRTSRAGDPQLHTHLLTELLGRNPQVRA